MEESTERDGAPVESGRPTIRPDVDVGEGAESLVGDDREGLAPSEAFQTLASEVRIAVLVELLAAERADEVPLAFSTLQAAAGGDSSAGFAYHLRQLSDHFVHRTDSGYVLTPAGRRAAEAVVAGTFTRGSRDRAS